jgi:hypothetical protein
MGCAKKKCKNPSSQKKQEIQNERERDPEVNQESFLYHLAIFADKKEIE